MGVANVSQFLITFGAAFITGLSGAMMPGPLLTVTITEAARRGFWAGPLLVLGHGILEFVLVVAFAFGLNRTLALPAVSGTIGLLGGGFLLWMGWGIAAGAYRGRVSLQFQQESGRSSLGPVGAGVVTSLSNPYWFMWWATAGATFILLSLDQGPLGLAAFYGGHISSDLVWYSLIALAVVTGRRFLSDRFYRGFLFCCGLFLMFLAATFLYSGIGFFARAITSR